MKKYYCEKPFVVAKTADKIVFYTYTVPDGESANITTLWEYNFKKNIIEKCFELRNHSKIWKYERGNLESDLWYLAVVFEGIGTVIGLDACGKEKFAFECEGVVSVPVFDGAGNIYISVNQVWLLCINSEGQLLWKWTPDGTISGKEQEKNKIKKYWFVRDKLFVIASEYIYLVSSCGSTKIRYEIEDYSMTADFVVQKDELFFKNATQHGLICCNFEGNKLWEYTVEQDKIVQRIYADEGKNIFVVLQDTVTAKSILYALGNEGICKWSIDLNGNSNIYVTNEEIIVLDKGSFKTYNKSGEMLLHYGVENYILWAGTTKNALIMIVQRQGNLAILVIDKNYEKKAVMMELSDQMEQDDDNICEDDIFWIKNIKDYLLRNVCLWRQYMDKESIEGVIVDYKYFDFIKVQAQAGENIYHDIMAKNIPYEIISDKDKDAYKEAGYISTIWTECCYDVEIRRIGKIVEDICRELKKELGVSVVAHNSQTG